MDRIALQILEDGWVQDGKTMRRVTAAADNAARCVRSFDGWCAAFLATVRSQFRDEL